MIIIIRFSNDQIIHCGTVIQSANFIVTNWRYCLIRKRFKRMQIKSG